MCDPMTLAIAGTAVAATGALVTGAMAAKSQRYQAAVADANAKAESAKAADAIDRGAEDQRNLARKYSGIRGAQNASISANGIDAGYGSGAAAIDDTNMYYQEDAATLSRNTGNEVAGIDMSAANYRAQAKAARMAATGSLVSAGFNAGGTILSGLGKMGQIKAGRAGGGFGG